MEAVIGEQSLVKYAKNINLSKNTKESIINTASFEEKYYKAKQEKEKQKEKTKEKEFNYEKDFKPEEIQPLVSRKTFKEYENREDDTIIQFNTEEKEGR